MNLKKQAAGEKIFKMMDIKPPIIVMGLPRSGTSLIAGIIYIHGAWVGEYHLEGEHNVRGNFVNKKIGKILLEEKKSCPDKIREAVLREMIKQEYQGGHWVVKHAFDPKRYNAWLKAFKPVWILVKRNPEDVLNSKIRSYIYKNKKSRVWDKEKIKRGIITKYSAMDNFLKKNNAFEIWPSELIKGNYQQIKYILKQIDLPFSKEKINKFILPQYWHGR